MPKKDRVETHSDDTEVSVQLKPVLGVRPGLYLSVLYGLALAVLVFFLLFYPGLRHRGVYLAVTSFPGQATVKVDGTFAGTTPCTVFVKRGTRQIEVSRPFFEPSIASLSVRGRIFATLLVPDRKKRSFELSIADIKGLLEWALVDFQRSPAVPEIVSDAAWAAYKAPQNRAALYQFLNDCMFYLTSEEQLRELVVAAGRTASSGTVLSPLGLASMVQQGIQVKQKYPNFGSWVLLSISRDSAKKLGAKPWIGQYLAGYRAAMSQYYQASFSGSNGSQGGARGPVAQGVAFRSVPQGTLVMGNDEKLENLGLLIDQTLPHPIAVGAFFLSETEVTNRQFQLFLDDSPDWLPANRAALMAKGLAGDQYLVDWTSGRAPAGREEYPVAGVSYHAAAAYCAWLTRKMAQSAPGAVVRLPTEAEWEWAARGGLKGMPYPLGEKPGASVLFVKGISGPQRAGASEPNGYGLRDTIGNVWEWCADSHAPAAFLLSSLDPAENARLDRSLPASGDRSVRGGSWNNTRDQVKVYTRGSQPADWCTPYLGFRVALVRP
jgi:formylglycine-generating enzyme required for sulfatase activity